MATTTISIRSAMGIGQRTVAGRASVPQSAVSAVEAGEAGRLALDTSLRVLEALGVEVRLQLDGPVVRGRSRRRDAVHAWTAGRVGERLRRVGWEVVDEAEVGSGRIRGYIDLLAHRPSDDAVVVIEVKTEIRDLGAIIRTLRWYAEVAPAAARRLGWRSRRVVVALVVLDSKAVEDELHATAEAARGAFPADPLDLGEWLADPSASAPTAFTVGFVDPASHRRAWLRRGRLHGRRTAATYVDYRDAVARLPRRPR
jgi:transcriptional regulator with XRE-family HTH domain